MGLREQRPKSVRYCPDSVVWFLACVYNKCAVWLMFNSEKPQFNFNITLNTMHPCDLIVTKYYLIQHCSPYPAQLSGALPVVIIYFPTENEQGCFSHSPAVLAQVDL